MRKVIISIISLIIILALLAVFVPYYMGGQLQQHQNKLFKLHGVFDNPNIKIKLIDYQRGWFSSTGKLQVTYQPPQSQAPTFKDTMNMTIQHGPFIISHTLGDHKKLYFARGVLHVNSDMPDLQFHGIGIWKLGNNFYYKVQAKQFSYGNFKQKITYQNINIRSKYNLTTKQLKYQLKIGRGQITMPYQKSAKAITNTYVTFKNLTVKAKLSGKNGHWLGTREFNIDNLTAKTPMNQLVQINELSGTTNSHEQQNKLYANLQIRANTLLFGNTNLHQFSIALSLNSLDSKATHQLLTLLQTSRTDKAFSATQKERLSQYYLQILNAGLNIDLNHIRFNSDTGQFNLSLHYAIKGSHTTQPFVMLIANSSLQGQLDLPKTWLKNALSYLFAGRRLQHDNITQPLAEQSTADAIITNALRKQLIKQTNTHYQIQFQLRNGELLLNGKKFNINTDIPKEKPSLIQP